MKRIVDRSRREHQHLGFDALADDLVHQPLITGFLVLVDVVVAEVVRLVDHHQVVVAPIDTIQRNAQRFSARAAQVGVAEHVVVEAISGEEVGLEVAVVVQPVVGKLLRAEHQDGLVAQFVILDHGQRGEGFAEADAVGEDAAVVGFQLVDQAGRGIALEVEQLLPDQAVQIAGAVVGQNILVHVFEEFLEDVVEHQEVDALW